MDVTQVGLDGMTYIILYVTFLVTFTIALWTVLLK